MALAVFHLLLSILFILTEASSWYAEPLTPAFKTDHIDRHVPIFFMSFSAPTKPPPMLISHLFNVLL